MSKNKSSKPPKQSSAPPPASLSAKQQLDQARIEQVVRLKKIDAFYRLMRTVAKCGTAFGISIFVYKSIDALAGQETVLNATINAIFKVTADRWVAYAVAALTTGGYYNERRLRHKTIRGHADYIKKLEQKIDHARSSSGLTITGIPTKEDLDA